MAVNQQKLDAFRQVALTQGYDPQEVEAFVAMAGIAGDSKDAERDTELQKWIDAVNKGYDVSGVPIEYRADVLSKTNASSGYTPSWGQPTAQPSITPPVSPAPVAPTAPTQNMSGTTDPMSQPGIQTKETMGLVGKIAKALTQPFVNTGKNIGSAVFETARAGATALRPDDKNKYSFYVDPNTGETTPNPFMNEEELAKVSEKPSLKKDSALRQQLSDSASIASWAVPFGKGANLTSKVLAPGATVGAMNSLDPGLDIQDVPGNVAEGAAWGAAGAGLMYGAGNLVGKAKNAFTKGGKVTTTAGKELTQGVRQIKTKAEVGGAQKEDLINKTLDSLGFKGTPEKQYRMLQPKMTQLEKKVRKELEKSPLKFDKNFVKKEIVATLDDQGLLVGEKAKKTAEKAVNDVMDDVVGKGVKGDLTSLQLFEVKQKLNKIRQRIQLKLDRGASTTPVEDVLHATRDAVDDVIAKYHSDVKGLTLAQSYLFDSAKSLSSARFNPPVLRVAGTSVPAFVTNTGKRVVGNTTQGVGKVMSGVGNIIPKVGTPGSLALNVGARTPDLLKDNINQPTDGTQNEQYYQTTDEETDTNQDSSEHTNSITLNPYNATPEQIYDEYQNALNAGDNKTAERLYGMYQDEVEYQEKNNKTTKLTATEKASESVQALSKKASRMLSTGNIKTGKIGGKAESLKANVSMADPATYDFNVTISNLKATIAKARAGSAFTPNEEKLLNSYVPLVGDSKQQLETKLRILQTDEGKSAVESLLIPEIPNEAYQALLGQGGGQGGGGMDMQPAPEQEVSDTPVLDKIVAYAVSKDIEDAVENPQIIAKAAEVLLKSGHSVDSKEGQKLLDNFFTMVEKAVSQGEETNEDEKSELDWIIGQAKQLRESPGLDIGQPEPGFMYR